MKALLWGGPLDGQEIEVDYVEQIGQPNVRLLLPDPASPGMKVVYQQTNRMKGQRRIYRIVQGAGC